MLLDRGEELACAARLANEAANGRGSALVLSGPAGIGKTRLLDAAAREAAAAGLHVLTARGAELEQDFPFGVVRQLLDPLLLRMSPGKRDELFAGAARLSRPVFGEDEISAVPVTATATLHGLYWLVATLAHRQPLALCIDDLHWSDPASRRFLVFLVRRVDEHAVLLAVASREDRSLEDLLEPHGGERRLGIRVAPLSPTAIAQLVKQGLGTHPDPEFVNACREETDGNPFFLTQLMTELAALGVEPTAIEATRVHEIGVEGVERFVERRIRRASLPMRTLASTLAIVGEDVDSGELTQLSGLSAAEVEGAIADLSAMGLVRLGDPPSLAHPIVRRAIANLIPVVQRDILHRLAARRAADSGALEKAATHVLAMTPAGDVWAVAILRRAATLALGRGAPDAAAAALRRALLEPPPSADRPALLLALGSAEALAGDPRAVESLTAALDAANAGDRPSAALTLGRVLSSLGRIDEAVAALEQGKRGLGPDQTDQVHRLEADIRFALQNASRPLPMPPLEEIEALLDRPTPGARALLAVLGLEASLNGKGPDAVRYATAALAGGRLLEDEDLLIPMLPPLTLSFSDRPDAGAEWLTRIMARAQIRGAVVEYTAALCWRAHAHLRAGRIERAEEDARAAWETEDLEWMGHPATAAFLIRVLVARAQLDEAREVSRQAGSLAVRETMNGLLLLHARGIMHAADGRYEEALEEFLGCGRGLLAARAPGSLHVPWRADAAVVLVQLGRGDQARALAAENVEIAQESGLPSPLGVALRAAGLANRDEELLGQAVAVLRGSPARLELACALTDLGTLRHSRAGAESARPLLREALDLAGECGAIAQAQRARDALRATGARPHRTRITGGDALTASERRVAALAADGATNREIAESLFVTLKTVEKHLAAAYRKLGIDSRSDLFRVLSDGPVDPNT